MNLSWRAPILITITSGLVALVFLWMGAAYGVRMALEAACFAVIALGLTMQWGYAGLFNAGIMGFIAMAAFVNVLVSFPVNASFVALGGLQLFAAFFLVLSIGTFAGLLLLRLLSPHLTARWRSLLAVVMAIGVLAICQAMLAPAVALLESNRDWVGGIGLPVALGWIGGSLAAGCLGWAIGRMTLGLRADYLAIATLGIAEIVIAILKNADWLTRGTVTVSPLPWPVPSPQEAGFVMSRAFYLAVALAVVTGIYLLLERAWASPWGRMMRAMRDNETASAAFGKDVNRRRLEVFVLGNVIVGLGGAMLVTSSSIFDPTSFSALNHTFLIWVMVIVGGAGNNLGTVLGAFLIYVIWTMSEPATLLLFETAADWAQGIFGWQAPSDLPTRALQMRVFLIGLTIVLVLRIAPGGLLPEKPIRYE